MNSWTRWVVQLCGALAMSCAVGGAAAQIKIGQTADFTGPIAPGVREASLGAKLYFDAVNKAGGIAGQQIEVLALDDKFSPALAAENAKKLIDQGVVALFLTRGTPHTQAIMPLLLQYRLPLVGPSSGAMALHQPAHPWLFNVRATYQREAERAIRHLSLIGMSRIALVQVDDSFGADAAAGAMAGFAAVGKQPVLHERFDRNKPDLSQIIPKVVKSEAQAVMLLAAGPVVADGAARLRAAGSGAQIVTLSNNASAGFIKMLGSHARGTVVSQVFPYERSIAAPIVKEAIESARAANVAEVTPSVLEGYTAAKVLVEGLRRAGPNITREKLRTALESFKRVDLGGLEVSYSATDHTGLDYADLSIIGDDGRFRR
ncbi:ABC transporter substrate-binding protein [Ideonella sp.]|uniref:ABC transporter substrate-binding protein n=1 Tax=Ideonella sp. TaxID=1929293 RepID=UPI0039C8ABF4